MTGFESSTLVRRPLEEVAAYLSDLGNDPQWRREWVAAEPTTRAPSEPAPRRPRTVSSWAAA